jgi:hypothetical protein
MFLEKKMGNILREEDEINEKEKKRKGSNITS